jgi:ankyrin repeat protein
MNPSAKDKYGATALHAAAFAGQTKCAILLIERKADVNAIDDQHQTALFRAAERIFINRLTIQVDLQRWLVH